MVVPFLIAAAFLAGLLSFSSLGPAPLGWSRHTYRPAADPDGQAAAKLGVASLPTTVFIGADGTLRGRQVGAMTATDPRGAIATYLGIQVP